MRKVQDSLLKHNRIESGPVKGPASAIDSCSCGIRDKFGNSRGLFWFGWPWAGRVGIRCRPTSSKSGTVGVWKTLAITNFKVRFIAFRMERSAHGERVQY